MRILLTMITAVLICGVSVAQPQAPRPPQAPEVSRAEFDNLAARVASLEESLKGKTATKAGCICGDDCKCKPGDCPGKCPVALPTVIKGADPRDAFVVIRLNAGPRSTASGSGVCISCENGVSFILTNRHVSDAGDDPVVIHKGKTYPAKRIHNGSGVSGDLAVLFVEAEIPAVAVADEDPTPGESWWKIGYRTGETRGRFTETVTFSDDGKQLLGDLPGEQGDSGSGVFNSRNELIGILWGATGTRDGMKTGVVPVSSVQTLIVEHRPRFGSWLGGLASRWATRVAARRASASIVNVSGNPSAPVSSSCPGGQCGVPTRGQFYPIRGGFPVQGGCANGQCYR